MVVRRLEDVDTMKCPEDGQASAVEEGRPPTHQYDEHNSRRTGWCPELTASSMSNTLLSAIARREGEESG